MAVRRVNQRSDDFVRFLKLEIETTAQRFGLPAQVARDFARALEEETRRRYGGDQPYVAKVDYSERRAAVLADFTGANHAEVCAKHGINSRTLYNYLRPRREQRCEIEKFL